MREQVNALHIDGHSRIPLFLRGRIDTSHRYNPGVVEEDVDTTKALDGEIDDSLHVGGSTNITIHCHRFAALFMDGRGGPLSAAGVDVGDDHRRSFTREQLG